MPEAPPFTGEDPLPDAPVAGDEPIEPPRFSARHSQADVRSGPKFEDSKQEAANSGYGRVDGTQVSMHVHCSVAFPLD